MKIPAWLKRSYFIGGLVSSSKEAAELLRGQPPTATKIYVDEFVALNYSAVWACINLIAGDISTLPCALYQRRTSGMGKDEFHDPDGLYNLVHDEPNPEMSIVDFLEADLGHMLSWGNGYAEIERDLMGRPRGLWPIAPARVQPYRDRLANGKLGPLEYLVDSKGPTLAATDVLHFHGLGYDGTCGYSPINKAREAIALGLAAEKFGGSFYGNGSTFGGVLSVDADIDPQQAEDLRKAIEKVHQSSDKAHRLLVIPGGQRFDKIGIPPNEAQFLETRKFQVTEIARWYRVPPHKIADLEHATFSNIEQQDLDYYKSCLRRWIVRIEKELNRKLLTPEQRQTLFFKFNVDAFLRGDIGSRYTAFGIARDKGIINADEWRDLEDMNPQEGGQGKIYLVQQAQVPLARIDELTSATIDAKKAKPVAPAKATPTPDQLKTIRLLEGTVTKAERAAVEYQERAHDLEVELVVAVSKGESAREEVSKLQTQLRDATAQAAALRSIADGLSADMDEVVEHQADLAAMGAEAQKHLEEARQLRTEAEALRGIEREAREQLETLRDQNTELNRELERRTHHLALLERDPAHQEARAQATAAQNDANTLREQVKSLTANLSELTTRLEEHIARASEAERKLQDAAHQAALTQRDHEAQTLKFQVELEKSVEQARRIDLACEQQATRLEQAYAANTAETLRAAEAVERGLALERALEIVRAESQIERQRLTNELITAQRQFEVNQNLFDEVRASLLVEQTRLTETLVNTERRLDVAGAQLADAWAERAQFEAEAEAGKQRVTVLEDHVIELREQVTRGQAEVTALNAQLLAASEARTKAEQELTLAKHDINYLTFNTDKELANAQARVERLEATLDERRRDLEALQAEANASIAVNARLSDELKTGQRDLEQAREAARENLANAAKRVEHLELAHDEVTRQVEAERARAGETEAARHAAEERVADLERRLEASSRERDEIESRLSTEVDRIEDIIEATEAAAAVQRTEQTRMAAELSATQRYATVLIGAHRLATFDVTRRLLDREIDGIQRAQGSADKLKQRIVTFYEGHEAILANALVAPARVHLAAIRSDADPVVLAASLATEHVARSRAELQAVIDGDADVFGKNLSGLLARWNEHRANAIPDRLMKIEIEGPVPDAPILPDAKPRKVKRTLLYEDKNDATLITGTLDEEVE